MIIKFVATPSTFMFWMIQKKHSGITESRNIQKQQNQFFVYGKSFQTEFK